MTTMKKSPFAFLPFASFPLVSAILVSVSIAGCSNTPTHLIVSPDLMTTPKVQYVNKSAQFSVKDMRTAQHVIQILHDGEAAQLMNSQEALTAVVEQTLKKAFKQQGLTLSAQANNHIEVIIDKALISVEQGMVSYQAKNELAITVKVKNSAQTLTKTFTSKGTSDGPIGVDIAVLERDFNQQLSKLLNRIITNDEVKSFIN